MLIFIFIFGLIIGSFLNVVILRLKSGQDIIWSRSNCPHCQHQLTAVDLFPLVSFLWLRGRCRYCHSQIAWQYPMVELATGLLFLFSFNQILAESGIIDWLFFIKLFIIWLSIASLIIIFVYDLKWMLIPDSVVLPSALIIFLLNWLIGYEIWNLLLGVFLGFGFFAIQYFISGGRWIGGGDLRLGIFMGCLLGFEGTILALFLAYISGAIISLILLALKRVSVKSAVPFGVFICPAILIVWFFGENLINWYLAFLL